MGREPIAQRNGAEATVRAYIYGLNSGDPEVPAACVSDGFVNEHISTSGERVVGRDAYRKRLVAFLADFRDLHYEIEDMIIDDQRVAVPYVMTGKWAGPETGSQSEIPFSIRGMFRFRVENGKIAHRIDYWDSADFERQVRSAGS